MNGHFGPEMSGSEIGGAHPGLDPCKALAPRAGELKRVLVRSDVPVYFDFVRADADPHAGQRSEGLGEALGGRAHEDKVEMRDRYVVFPDVDSFHGIIRSGGSLELLLAHEGTVHAHMARGRPELEVGGNGRGRRRLGRESASRRSVSLPANHPVRFDGCGSSFRATGTKNRWVPEGILVELEVGRELLVSCGGSGARRPAKDSRFHCREKNYTPGPDKMP